MEKLDEANKKSKGRMFIEVGEGDTRTMLFDKPVRRQLQGAEGQPRTMDEFLAVTTDGYKLIQVDDGTKGNAWAIYGAELYESNLLAEHLRSYFKKTRWIKQKYPKAGYSRGRLKLNSRLEVDENGMQSIGEDITRSWRTAGARLVHDTEPDVVAKIADRNQYRYTEGPRRNRIQERAEASARKAQQITEGLDGVLGE